MLRGENMMPSGCPYTTVYGPVKLGTPTKQICKKCGELFDCPNHKLSEKICVKCDLHQQLRRIVDYEKKIQESKQLLKTGPGRISRAYKK